MKRLKFFALFALLLAGMLPIGPASAQERTPLPIPIVGERDSPIRLHSAIVHHNFRTGQTDLIPWQDMPDLPLSGRVKGKLPAGRLPSPAEGGAGILNFSAWSQVVNPQAYPWSTATKLFIDFPGGAFVGSGVLIDSKAILTAGHCVQDDNHGGWATSLTVVPAYANGNQPFGEAHATDSYAWHEWTFNGDYDWDMAVVLLDRPVGALAGHVGYLYNDNDAYFNNRAFETSGYPAAAPFNGETMWRQNGTWDSIGTHQFHFDQDVKGGQSGSGAYTFDGGNYVYGICSHTHTFLWSSYSAFTRINGRKFNDIHDFIADGTPGAPDLWPLRCRTASGTITAGSSLSHFEVVIHNYSSVAISGTIPVDVYLSTDSTISTTDTLIGHYFLYGGLGPKESAFIDLNTGPTIPIATRSGNYFLGVLAGQRISNGWDAATVAVTENRDTTIQAQDRSVTLGRLSDLSATLLRRRDNTRLSGKTLNFFVDATLVGSAVTGADGIAHLSFTPANSLNLGRHTMRAAFAGDALNNSSSGTAGLSAYTDTTLAVSGVSAARGQTVSLNATLTRSGTGAAIAGVSPNFYLDGNYLGSAVTNANGLASFSYTLPNTLSLGSHALQVRFEPRDWFNASQVNATLMVVKGNTTVTVSPITAQIQQTVTLTANLRRASDGTPLSGEIVDFQIGASSIALAVTDAGGNAGVQYTVPERLGVSTQTIRVNYAGSNFYNGSSGTNTLTINKGNTNITIAYASGTFGDTASLSATLLRATDGAPLSGRTLRFMVNELVVGTAVTNAGGVALLPFTITEALGAGSKGIVVSYAGDSLHNASIGSGVLKVLPYAATLSVFNNSGAAGSLVVLQANLKRSSNNAPLSGKSVTFKVLAFNLTGTTNAAGVATVNFMIPAGTAPGSKTITGSFAGDSLYAPAAGTGTLTVR